jgi:antitoxin component of MazEF toxin-antitoxin module
MRKLKEKNIRKLIRLGRASLAVTLPKELTDKLKWQEKEKVKIKQVGRKLVITDWKR